MDSAKEKQLHMENLRLKTWQTEHGQKTAGAWRPRALELTGAYPSAARALSASSPLSESLPLPTEAGGVADTSLIAAVVFVASQIRVRGYGEAQLSTAKVIGGLLRHSLDSQQ